MVALALAACVAAAVDWDAYADVAGDEAPVYVALAAPFLAIVAWGTFRHTLPRYRRRRHARAVVAGRAEARTLGEILSDLPRKQDELVIYARRPWTPSSRALVLEEHEPVSFDPHPDLPGFDYFMHVWMAHHDAEFFPDDPVGGLIRYAEQEARQRAS
ncbi:MAG TPA: hypothetical protein VHF45_09605 [Thermoleophilaceae bacterium]|nr:hypothetical protein [Thermoleophilaceae bacterium]